MVCCVSLSDLPSVVSSGGMLVDPSMMMGGGGMHMGPGNPMFGGGMRHPGMMGDGGVGGGVPMHPAGARWDPIGEAPRSDAWPHSL